jgi:hypothetical protein
MLNRKKSSECNVPCNGRFVSILNEEKLAGTTILLLQTKMLVM